MQGSNYYRLLGVQPDAPARAIADGYAARRDLPQPGGALPDAEILDTAWETLHDPSRRAAYDQTLLTRYGVALPSGAGRAPVIATATVVPQNRSYYRILGVEREAPQVVIDASYRLWAQIAPCALMEEAYATLRDPAQRAVYDRLLALRGHAEAAARSRGPRIKRYCAFCKTPHDRFPRHDEPADCVECSSPLFIAPGAPAAWDADRRGSPRRLRSSALVFFCDWPGRPNPARLLDFSPVGLRLTTRYPLCDGQVLKIAGPDFRCVAEVIHCTRAGSRVIAGASFLAASLPGQMSRRAAHA